MTIARLSLNHRIRCRFLAIQSHECLAVGVESLYLGIYIIRRRQLIELIERCAAEDRVDFVRDILVRYKNLKRIYAYKIDSYWSNIASAENNVNIGNQ